MTIDDYTRLVLRLERELVEWLAHRGGQPVREVIQLVLAEELLHHVEARYDPREKWWMCKIGPASEDELPPGADGPLRSAVEAAFEEMLGRDSAATFSGWGHNLTNAERDVIREGD